MINGGELIGSMTHQKLKHILLFHKLIHLKLSLLYILKENLLQLT